MLSDDCQNTLSKKELGNISRRKSRRLPCISTLAGTVDLSSTGKTLEVTVLELSPTGAGFLTVDKIEIGEEIILTLKSSEGGATHPFPAVISHCTMGNGCFFRTGCQFKEPIDAGLLKQLVG
jgi:hypothetical protein